MQEINWGNLKTKFNGKEQSSFEWLCYLLFCKEFNQASGIFRYKNHAGIETNPIKINNKYIGFQAKFYDTRLSEHKKDFIESIDTAKNNHPELNEIIFYINKDFPQGKKENEPQYKIKIENYAKSKNVKITWKTASFFESPFVCEKNFNIAQHFFSREKSIIDFISELIQHTESILEPIRSKITFNDYDIKIDRAKIVNDITKTLKEFSLIILSGVGGVGKTAVIKDFYGLHKKCPCFVFKANEFNIESINQYFKNYGDYGLTDFIKEYKEITEKYIIIDSAEKLSDIENQEIFKEFLSALLNSGWKIIFTTRHSYLDDLKYQFIELYNLNFKSLNIETLTRQNLEDFSKKYNFKLPSGERLQELLRNPFYLNKYLQNYSEIKASVNYSAFKNIIWDKEISASSYRKNNTHIKRENCFIEISWKRANTGCFYVKTDNCESEILNKLEQDEIIKYDSNADGYFITHDIYEEWGLDKVIERAFNQSNDYEIFYQNIGSSLSIRRAFRNWLSEKLFNEKNKAENLIQNTINNDKIENCWKDEVLVSVLLSDYSKIFFQLFEKKLLENNIKMFIKIIFLLRTACKEIDDNFLNIPAIHFALKTLFTKPKGSGWNCVINFINKRKKEFGLKHINIILPLLDDWNNKNKQGKTTKKASKIALFYYNKILENDSLGYHPHDKIKKYIIKIILNGSFEIKNELTDIFNEVLSKKENSHRAEHYDLIHTVLSEPFANGIEIIKNLPEQVIKLADLFWFQNPDEQDWYSERRFGVEQSFCLPEHRFKYYPASAFQTPIFWLLQYASIKTIDFILSFTNKTVECHRKSEFRNEVKEIEIRIDDKKAIKQYISDRLWSMYRGTQVPTYLLSSIHMALEKWLLQIAKTESEEVLVYWCKYLIENSKSASITGVVASIVLSQPSKLFNIAKILFQTKELFFYDNQRLFSDQGAKDSLLMLKKFGGNYKNERHDNESIKACDDEHRKKDLEHVAVIYQFFKDQNETVPEVEKRKTILWEIWDKYYEELPAESEQTEADKTWRLCLARMDARKINLTAEEKDGKTLINFNPEIAPELEKYSKKSLNKFNNKFKYTKLRIWAQYRFEKNKEEYKKYPQYENNPQLVISETKEIIKGLKSKKEEHFFVLNSSIPAYTCSVLIRDFFDKLNEEDREYCKNMIIWFALNPLQAEHYFYQGSDGSEQSINVLPYLIKFFPKDKKRIKLLLFLLVLNYLRKISIFAIKAIFNHLWEISFEDANSLFLGYLLLKQKYNDTLHKVVKENRKNGIFNHSESSESSESNVIKLFSKTYNYELEQIINNKIIADKLENIDKLDLEILEKAFLILPFKTAHKDHKKFLNQFFAVLAKKLFIKEKTSSKSGVNRYDYDLRRDTLEKLAYFILNCAKDEIKEYLKPFLDNLSNSKETANFFRKFISVEDRINKYESSWIVWDIFYPKIVEICKKQGSYGYTKEIVSIYLLACPYWKEDAKEWHTLKEREKLFFKKVVKDIGEHPSVLYSIAKILNEIGSGFIEDGITWINDMLKKNAEYTYDEFETDNLYYTNTIYYIENIIRKYCITNRQKIKTESRIKNQVVSILNFLVEQGSVTGYLLRENIL